MRVARKGAKTDFLRFLEAKQSSAGITFTSFGHLDLDVSGVQGGRITLRQAGRKMRLLPETLSGLHSSIENKVIPRPTPRQEPWMMSTFAPGDAQGADDIEVFLDESGSIAEVNDKKTGAAITVTFDQLSSVVQSIVDPWLKSFSELKSPGMAVE